MYYSLFLHSRDHKLTPPSPTLQELLLLLPKTRSSNYLALVKRAEVSLRSERRLSCWISSDSDRTGGSHLLMTSQVAPHSQQLMCYSSATINESKGSSRSSGIPWLHLATGLGESVYTIMSEQHEICLTN